MPSTTASQSQDAEPPEEEPGGWTHFTKKVIIKLKSCLSLYFIEMNKSGSFARIEQTKRR